LQKFEIGGHRSRHPRINVLQRNQIKWTDETVNLLSINQPMQ